MFVVMRSGGGRVVGCGKLRKFFITFPPPVAFTLPLLCLFIASIIFNFLPHTFLASVFPTPTSYVLRLSVIQEVAGRRFNERLVKTNGELLHFFVLLYCSAAGNEIVERNQEERGREEEECHRDGEKFRISINFRDSFVAPSLLPFRRRGGRKQEGDGKGRRSLEELFQLLA